MTKKTAVESFTKHFCGDVDNEILSLISDISHMVKINKSEMLFLEGDEGRHLFYLSSGSIKLFRSNDDGKEAIIRFIEPGDFFAELILFLNNRYPVSATAIEPSVLLAINAQELFKCIKTHPEVAMKLIGKLTAKTQYLIKMVEDMTLTDVKKRFLNYLKHLIEKTQDNTVTLPVPKGELSVLLGISPATLSRLLKKLTEDGIVKVDGRKIRILVPLDEL